MGIGAARPVTYRGNAHNEFKARLMAIEDKFFQSDMEISRAKHLIRCIENNKTKREILKLAKVAGNYEEIINEETDLEASLRTLRGIVG